MSEVLTKCKSWPRNHGIWVQYQNYKAKRIEQKKLIELTKCKANVQVQLNYLMEDDFSANLYFR